MAKPYFADRLGSVIDAYTCLAKLSSDLDTIAQSDTEKPEAFAEASHHISAARAAMSEIIGSMTVALIDRGGSIMAYGGDAEINTVLTTESAVLIGE